MDELLKQIETFEANHRKRMESLGLFEKDFEEAYTELDRKIAKTNAELDDLLASL